MFVSPSCMLMYFVSGTANLFLHFILSCAFTTYADTPFEPVFICIIISALVTPQPYLLNCQFHCLKRCIVFAFSHNSSELSYALSAQFVFYCCKQHDQSDCLICLTYDPVMEPYLQRHHLSTYVSITGTDISWASILYYALQWDGLLLATEFRL